MAEKVSNAPWHGDASRYTDSQWEHACVLDRDRGDTAKERYGCPVREPDGTLNRKGLGAADAALNGARASHLDATDAAVDAAKRKLAGLYKDAGLEMAKAEATEVRAPLLKTEREGFFLAPVLVPGVPDSHGHVFEKDEIERISRQVIRAYAFSKDGRPNRRHAASDVPDVELVENYIQRSDVVIGGERVPAGTLMQGFQVHDPLLKDEIERDEIGCLSWEGRGFLTDID